MRRAFLLAISVGVVSTVFVYDYFYGNFVRQEHIIGSSSNPPVTSNKDEGPEQESAILSAPFYMYDDDDITMNGLHKSCEKFKDEDTHLLELLENHRARTFSPTNAVLFIITTPIQQSGRCGSKEDHVKRVRPALEKLLGEPWFTNNLGNDHLMPGHHWHFSAWTGSGNFVPAEWQSKLENVTMTRYEYYGKSKWENLPAREPVSLWSHPWEITKRTIVDPYLASAALPLIEPKLENWLNRTNLIFYHTRRSPSAHGGTPLRHLPTQKPELFEGSVGFDIPRDEWVMGWGKSKFCLVIRGDTPTTHAFYNAIKSSCIPVIISDTFELVGLPFKNHIRLEKFTLRMEEKVFLTKPETLVPMLVEISTKEIRSMLHELEAVQPMLLYDHPNTTVADLVLDAAVRAANQHPY